MKCFLILGFAAGNPKAVFKVVDGTFYGGSDIIGTFHSSVLGTVLG